MSIASEETPRADPRAVPPKRRRIVIAYDGSTHSRRAIELAAGLFDAEALIQHVAAPPIATTPVPGAPAVAPAGPLVTPEEEAETERRAQRVAQDGVKLAEQAGLHARPVVSRGAGPDAVARAIVELADEAGADAIVVGQRGVSRLRSALLGSVSHEVVLHSHVPVLVAPPVHDEHGGHAHHGAG